MQQRKDSNLGKISRKFLGGKNKVFRAYGLGWKWGEQNDVSFKKMTFCGIFNKAPLMPLVTKNETILFMIFRDIFSKNAANAFNGWNNLDNTT